MRQLVKRVTDNVVTHYFPTGGASLTEAGLQGPNVHAPSMRPSDYQLVNDVLAPENDFVGSQYTYDGSWAVINSTALDAAVEEHLQAQAPKLISDIKAARSKLLYTDISVPFPTDSHVIQFRNESDRGNLRDKVAGAMAHIIDGNPGAAMKYRTADNTEVDLTAQQLLGAGMAILNAKDALYYQFTALIDAARAASTLAGLDQIKEDLTNLVAGS